MSDMYAFMRDSQYLDRAIKKVYPNLPKYPHIDFRTKFLMVGYVAGVRNWSAVIKMDEEDIINAEQMDEYLSLNCQLLKVIGKELDTLFPTEELRCYLDNLSEYKKIQTVFLNEKHSVRYIDEYLDENYHHYSYFREDDSIHFQCFKAYIDTSNKWNPSRKYLQTDYIVQPNDIERFLPYLDELNKEREDKPNLKMVFIKRDKK